MKQSANSAKKSINELVKTFTEVGRAKEFWSGAIEDKPSVKPNIAGLIGKEMIFDLDKASYSIKDVTEETEEASRGCDNFNNSLKNVDKELKQKPKDAQKAAKGIDNVKESAKKASTGLGYFFKSLKRIAMYRAIYAGMKAIQNGFEEGAKTHMLFQKW